VGKVFNFDTLTGPEAMTPDIREITHFWVAPIVPARLVIDWSVASLGSRSYPVRGDRKIPRNSLSSYLAHRQGTARVENRLRRVHFRFE
jgi:hypothetical protein